MEQIIVYVLIGVVVFLILFLTIRFILQMIFLRDCPNCGHTVSLAVTRECPECGYVFLKNRQIKLNVAIVVLALAVGVFVFLDVHFFREQTADYLAANPYLWRGEATQSAEDLGVVSDEVAGTLPEETPDDAADGGDGETPTSGNPIAGFFQDILDGLN